MAVQHRAGSRSAGEPEHPRHRVSSRKRVGTRRSGAGQTARDDGEAPAELESQAARQPSPAPQRRRQTAPRPRGTGRQQPGRTFPGAIDNEYASGNSFPRYGPATCLTTCTHRGRPNRGILAPPVGASRPNPAEREGGNPPGPLLFCVLATDLHADGSPHRQSAWPFHTVSMIGTNEPGLANKRPDWSKDPVLDSTMVWPHVQSDQ